MKEFMPLPGKFLFTPFLGRKSMVLAVNPRITLVLPGIFNAAKELDAPFVVELAKSECNLQGGYTGLTPAEFAKRAKAEAVKAGFDCWALHADHLQVKENSPKAIAEVKELISAQIKSGFTSFSIDASFLFDLNAEKAEGQLHDNIEVSSGLAKYIAERAVPNFGLEVEVGEIGKKNQEGMVLTTPEEAVCFLRELHERNVVPHALAIANGSIHGNIFDKTGKAAEQSIDLNQTIAVGKAIAENALNTGLSQHGITGTPLSFFNANFPFEFFVKANVGTEWMNLVWNVFEEKEPKLFSKIKNWTIENFSEKAKEKGIASEEEIFGKFGKYSIKEFFKEIYSVKAETKKEIESRSFARAKEFFKAFNLADKAHFVRREAIK